MKTLLFFAALLGASVGLPNASGSTQLGVIGRFDAIALKGKFVVSDGLGYAGRVGGGITVIDVRDAAGAQAVATGFSNWTYVFCSLVVERYVYAYQGFGLEIIDTTVSTAFKIVGSEMYGTSTDITDMNVVGERLYLLTDGNSNVAGFHMADVSRASLSRGFIDGLGLGRLPDDARGVAARTDYSFVANGAAGLQVVDVRGFGDLPVVGNAPTAGFARDVELRSNY